MNKRVITFKADQEFTKGNHRVTRHCYYITLWAWKTIPHSGWVPVDQRQSNRIGVAQSFFKTVRTMIKKGEINGDQIPQL